MKPNFSNRVIGGGNSGLGCFLTIFLISLLFGAVGLKWVVNGFLILIALVIILPIVGVSIFSWWIKRNLVEDTCPVCDYTVRGLKNDNAIRCLNCGEELKIQSGAFVRNTPDDVIEVQVVEAEVVEVEVVDDDES